MARFGTLYSSSSGNCAYIGEGEETLLIDCGKNCKTTINALYSLSIAVSSIRGILITHEHTDHISGLAVLLKHYAIPIYGSPSTLKYLVTKKLVPDNATLIPVLTPATFKVGSFSIKPFETCHDSLCAYGYHITTNKGKRIGYLTDSGIVPPNAFNLLSGCDLVAIEANYDEQLLAKGPYPYYLKRRISSDNGHLCNTDSAESVAKLIKTGVTKFTMCHLSKENNRPEKVMTALAQTFYAHGITSGDELEIKIAPSDTPLQPMEV